MSFYSDQTLYQSLKELNVIKPESLVKALAECKGKNLPLGDVLIDEDLISDENLGKIIADLYQVPFINLSQISIKEDVLKIIPETVAKKQKSISFEINKETLYLAINDPKNIEIIEFITKKSGLNVKIFYATNRDINSTLSLYHKDVRKAFDEIIKENIEMAKGSVKTDPPIIKIVNTLISHAYQSRASDIHIEPSQKHSLVRFRIDGVLHDIIDLPVELHPQIVTRIKVESKLRTDEHQASQDGKLVFQTDEERLDIRVSIVPITEGEKIVMRLLSEKSRQFSLQDLGLKDKDLKKVEEAVNKPYGMVLSTGPTGSGKTTSLYAVLKILNQRDVNIMTIEDPVEYEIESINQIQVNPKTNLTFAAGLRSILRQDPNIILVGEIRDDETASIAINSAMTGHLVLSTLHTNDSSTAIPRLLEMKIEPYLVASTVNIIIAQRLVRKICQKCRVSKEINIDEPILSGLSEESKKNFFKGKKIVRVYQGKGCSVCHQTGYQDRIGIFEVLLMDDQIRQAVIDKKDAGTIRKIANKNGMRLMIDDGLEKVKEGITSIEEIIRVTKE